MYRIINYFRSTYESLFASWNYYKNANGGKKYLAINYIVWVLIYRRLLCTLLAFPLFIIYLCLYPFVKLRFIKLIGSAIGHYSVTTELLLCKMAALPKSDFINVFYMEHSLFEPSICNQQLHRMWKRRIIIAPLTMSGLLIKIDQLIMRVWGQKAYGLWGEKTYYEHRWCKDIDSYLKTETPQLSFTQEENFAALSQLKKLNIPESKPFVCLLVRSNEFNQGHPAWDYPERNADFQTYLKACNWLCEQGYYVIRMGKSAQKIEAPHPHFIDYASSPNRSDFMDIYLTAHCQFFISTGTGLDGVAQIFRRPILYTNFFVMPYIATFYPHTLFISKKVFKKNVPLSFKEQCYYFTEHPDFIANPGFHIASFLKKHQLQLIPNSEDEILESVQEMVGRIKGEWQEAEGAKTLQQRFWQIFPTKVNDVYLLNKNKPLHGEIFIKAGAKFLERHSDLLD